MKKNAALLIVALLPLPSFSTINASSNIEVRTTGSDTNGGAFATGTSGTDYSQQDSVNSVAIATTTLTNGISTSSTTVNVISGSRFVTNDYVQVDSEKMIITGGGGSTALSVTRAQLGTSAATHSNGATITNISNLSTTDAVTAGNTTITSATANFTANLIGNIIYLSGGTGAVATNWYQVTARASNTSITVDRSTGLTAGTGVTMNIGGALKSPGQAAIIWQYIGGETMWIKSGTYLITSTNTNVSNGCLNLTISGTAPSWGSIQGYGSARGDNGTRPILQASGISSMTIITNSGSNYFNNFIIDGNSVAQSTGVLSTGGSRTEIDRVKVQNTKSFGFNVTGGTAKLYLCEVTGASGVGAFSSLVAGVNMRFCEAYGNTTTGFVGAGIFDHCIASGNTGASHWGFDLGTILAESVFNCVAYGNGGGGFRVDVGGGTLFDSNVSEGNTGWGFTTLTSAVTKSAFLINNAAFNNSSGNFDTTNLPNFSNNISPTMEVFSNPGSGDFSLNVSTSGGALVRNARSPGTYPRGTTTSYDDIGAAKHKDPTTGGAWLQ